MANFTSTQVPSPFRSIFTSTEAPTSPLFTSPQVRGPPNLTSSTSKTPIIKGSHNFKIQEFSFTKGMGVGKYLSSDIFSVGGHLWEIQFFPDGKKNDEGDDIYVSLFNTLVSKSEEGVRVWLDFFLLDQYGDKWFKSPSGFRRMTKDEHRMTGPHTVNDGNATIGYLKFCKITELEAPQFVKDDCLTIQCTVAVWKTSMDGPKSVAQLSDLRQSYKQLLESREESDVSFEVDGETFYAHKLILATRSPVFKAQFFGPLKEENTHCIKVEEMHAPVFKALLHFIYCDVIPDVEEVPAGLKSKCGDTMITQHLLVAADRYGIQTLKSFCEAKLCENIAINTVAASLTLAEQHGCFLLKSSCLEFIRLPKNLEAVIQTDGFKNLKESCPAVIDELLISLARVRDYSYGSHGLGSSYGSHGLGSSYGSHGLGSRR